MVLALLDCSLKQRHGADPMRHCVTHILAAVLSQLDGEGRLEVGVANEREQYVVMPVARQRFHDRAGSTRVGGHGGTYFPPVIVGKRGLNAKGDVIPTSDCFADATVTRLGEQRNMHPVQAGALGLRSLRLGSRP